MALLKSVLHNIGVLIVSAGVALIGIFLDTVFALPSIASSAATIAGGVALLAGSAIRVWATWHFHTRDMRVIVLSAQQHLITDGPYRYSRNPLYLGGNLFMFAGACLIAGTPGGLALTAVGLVATDVMIRREEQQLSDRFGSEWTQYKQDVRRWL